MVAVWSRDGTASGGGDDFLDVYDDTQGTLGGNELPLYSTLVHADLWILKTKSYSSKIFE